MKSESPYEPASHEIEPDSESSAAGEPAAPPEISKRAARRVLQRAFVLVGRDRTVRQHIRQAALTTVWTLEDWHLDWTVSIDHGKVEYDRRPARAPDLTLIWPSAEEFFSSLWEGKCPDASRRLEGDSGQRRYLDPVYSAFCRLLQQVLREPFDEAGNRLW